MSDIDDILDDYRGRFKSRRNVEYTSRYRATHERKYRYNCTASTRPFIGIDGEGYDDDKLGHIYTLLAASDGSKITDYKGIKSRTAFEYLLDLKSRNTDGIFVSFYFTYDVNMILKDVPHKFLDLLNKNGYVRLWEKDKEKHKGEGYRVEYMPRKFFKVSRFQAEMIEGNWKFKTVNNITIFDTFGFFQSSFLTAVNEFDVGTKTERELLTGMKGKRDSFDAEMGDRIDVYNTLECRLLVEIMDKVRQALETADIHLTRWHGGGAIAGYLLNRYKVKECIRNFEDSGFQNAVACAYFGGRIQALQIGTFDATVYTHDLVSAYPSAMLDLPSLTDARIEYSSTYIPNAAYAVWHVKWTLPDDTSICPFPWRAKDGNILYPPTGKGYYWANEVTQAIATYGDSIEVLEGYTIEPEKDVKPFHFVTEVFDRRNAFKREGNRAQYALKLGLNSLYGKVCEGVHNDGSIPPWQCYTWAGMITSQTRGRMLSLIRGHEQSIITFATDGVYATEKLTKDGNGKLGSWECSEYASMFIVKPGIFECKDSEGAVTTSRVRGWRGSEVNFQQLREIWAEEGVAGTINLNTRRFVGIRSSSRESVPYTRWRQWIDIVKAFSFRPNAYKMCVPADAEGRYDVQSSYDSHSTYRVIDLPRGESHSAPYANLAIDDLDFWCDVESDNIEY